jgi:glyoxylase-like metal-dependent hydrolase (beta-lactamase superfamily II)
MVESRRSRLADLGLQSDPTIRLLCRLLKLRCGALIALSAVQLLPSHTSAELVIHRVEIGTRAHESRVPKITAQGPFLAPQAVSAVDVSADGGFITVGTMAFSHDANIWQFAPNGEVITKGYFPPWAPMQVATLRGGRAMAVGLAYSRVTSPDPTVWFGPSTELFSPTRHEGLAEADAPDGQVARLRPGTGHWRDGWLASHLGELFVHGPDWVFKPPRGWLDSEARRSSPTSELPNPLPTGRAMRMRSSPDGQHLAFGWLGLSRSMTGLPSHSEAVSVWRVNPSQMLWSAPAVTETPAPLPDPVADFPEVAKDFRLAADAIVPGHVTAAVAFNHDKSRTAIIEYGLWSWVRSQPAIGNWDPPIHALNFLPRQRAWLRVFDATGRELFREALPERGMFEVGFPSGSGAVWCWPSAWFARGTAGAVWLPVDDDGHSIYRVDLNSRQATAFRFPDAVADCAFSSRGRLLVSCWNGWIYLLEDSGKLLASLDAGSPARLAWSFDGAFAIAGTAAGRLLDIDPTGALLWNRTIPVTELPPPTQPPTEEVAGLPIFQGGRIPNSEHAYVGDIWVIKNGNTGVIIDAGGASGFSLTRARLQALGIQRITHLLHTHSHGDHCGAAYLWRALGAQTVAPQPAAFALTWLMPMVTDYGIYPPRPLDLPLPLMRPGDETDFEVSDLKFHALFVPGHSFDLTVYTTELAGRRIAFTGDLGFENQDILHRCWGDAEKASRVVKIIRDRLLPWKPDVVFTGHGVRTNGTEFLAGLVQHTEQSLAARSAPKKPERVD